MQRSQNSGTFATVRPGEPLLIVSHTFPPYRGIGGRRWAKFAKALARRRHPVHVIHSGGDASLLGSLWTDDIQHPGIIGHPLPQRYPTVLFKRPLSSVGEKIAYRCWSRVLPLLVKGNWYDKAAFWKRQLLHRSLELIDAHGIRQVVVTGAPFHLMAHLAELKRLRAECHLIADFRDPWSWGTVYGHASLGAERRAHEQRLEAWTCARYDKLISPAPAIVEHLRSTYSLGADRVVHVPHAVDPDDLGDPLPPRADDEFRMIYAGSLYGAAEAEHYFEQLLQGFERARSTHPAAVARCRFDLYITGHDTAPYEAKVRKAGLAGTINFHPPLTARALFPRMAQADLMVLFIPEANKDLLGTKFNEIFFLRRPLLHVGAPGLVSNTIENHRLGASVRVEQLRELLPSLITRERTVQVDATYDLSPHLLDPITDRLLAEVLV